MFFIPGYFIALLTFPGVIIHELAHQTCCVLCRVAVLKVCYFQFKNPAGYVIHEIPQQPWQHVVIGLGPFLFNTLLGALIAFPGVSIHRFHQNGILGYLLIWMGVSVAMHAFPSTGDAQAIWKAVWQEKKAWGLKVFATPLVGLIYLLALGSVFWLDLIYGFMVAVLGPKLLLDLLV